MADLVQTASSVLVDQTVPSQQIVEIAGEAINAGMPIIQTNNANGWWFKGNTSNGFQSGSVNGARIALGTALGAGQPITTLRSGRINLGATLSAGETYCISNVSGAIRPIGDMETNQFTTVLGFAFNTARMDMPAAGALVTNVARTDNVT
jgi:hypothetical protein